MENLTLIESFSEFKNEKFIKIRIFREKVEKYLEKVKKYILERKLNQIDK